MSNSKEDWNRYTHRPTEKVTHRGNTLPKNYCQMKKETPEWILLYFTQLAPLYQLISWSESAFLLDATIVCTHCIQIRKQNHSVRKVAPAARSIIKFTLSSKCINFIKIHLERICCKQNLACQSCWWPVRSVSGSIWKLRSAKMFH